MFSLVHSFRCAAASRRGMPCVFPVAVRAQYRMQSGEATNDGASSLLSSAASTEPEGNTEATRETALHSAPANAARAQTFIQSYTIHKRGSIPPAKEQRLVQMWRETTNDMGGENVVDKYGATFKDTRVNDPNETVEVKRRRLYYQSQYRGMVEMDLILGHFARCRLSNLDAALVNEYDTILKQYDSDLFNWLVMGQRAPDEVAGLRCFIEIQDFVRDNRHELVSGY